MGLNKTGRISHGESIAGKWTREYQAWASAKQRVKGQTNREYASRGIGMCPEWFNSYETFLRDMGRAPGPQYSLDRINNNGNYEPGNCRWATRKQQCCNRRNTLLIVFGGICKAAAEWDRMIGFREKTVSQRIERGWSVEKALTTPLDRVRSDRMKRKQNAQAS